jgi:hypothetical protein
MLESTKDVSLSPYTDLNDGNKFHYSVKHRTTMAKKDDPVNRTTTVVEDKRINGTYLYLPLLGLEALLWEDSLSKNALRLLRLCQYTLPINSTVVTLNAQVAKDIFNMAPQHFYNARKELLETDTIRPYYDSKDKYWFNYRRHGFRGDPQLYAVHGERTNNMVEAMAYEVKMKRQAAKCGDVGGVGDTDQPHEPKP